MNSNYLRKSKYFVILFFSPLITSLVDLTPAVLAQDTNHAKPMNPQAQRSQTRNARVQKAQQKLNEKGYRAGSPDGIMGTKTAQAIRKFQQDNRQPVTGTLDPATLTALGIHETSQAGTAARDSDEKDRSGEASGHSSMTGKQ